MQVQVQVQVVDAMRVGRTSDVSISSCRCSVGVAVRLCGMSKVGGIQTRGVLVHRIVPGLGWFKNIEAQVAAHTE